MKRTLYSGECTIIVWDTERYDWAGRQKFNADVTDQNGLLHKVRGACHGDGDKWWTNAAECALTGAACGLCADLSPCTKANLPAPHEENRVHGDIEIYCDSNDNGEVAHFEKSEAWAASDANNA